MSFDVRCFGARGDGRTDDTAPINAAISAAAKAGGGAVRFPEGRYRCLAVQGRNRVSLIGEGATLVKLGGGASSHILELVGSLAQRVSITGDVARGSTHIEIVHQAFAPGDQVLVRDERYAFRARGRNQELNRIAAVSGTQVYLASPTLDDYTVATRAELVHLAPVADLTVEGLMFEVPDGGGRFVGGAVFGRFASRVSLRGCTVVGADDEAAFQFEQSSWITLDGCSARDGQNCGPMGRGNGIVIGESSHHCLVTHCRTENVSENAFDSNARYSAFLNNIDVGSYDDAFNTHGSACRHIQIRGNFCIAGRGAGITVGFGGHHAGDRDILVADNTIVDPGTHGISVAASPDRPNTDVVLRGNSIIRPSRAREGCDGICVAGSHHITVTGNHIVGEGSKPAHGILAADSRGVTIQSNAVRALADGYGIGYIGCTDITITRNRISEVSSFNVYASPSRASSGVLIEGNRADDDLIRIQPEDITRDNEWGPRKDRAPGI